MMLHEANIYQVKEIDGIKILKVSGEFTIDTTPQIHKVCEKMVKCGKIRAILLDIQDVVEIDTAAFACLVEFMKEHTKEGIKIGILHLNAKEHYLMEILRIDEAIMTFAGEEEALEALL